MLDEADTMIDIEYEEDVKSKKIKIVEVYNGRDEVAF